MKGVLLTSVFAKKRYRQCFARLWQNVLIWWCQKQTVETSLKFMIIIEGQAPGNMNKRVFYSRAAATAALKKKRYCFDI